MIKKGKLSELTSAVADVCKEHPSPSHKRDLINQVHRKLTKKIDNPHFIYHDSDDTPAEVVGFMVGSAQYLLRNHFKRRDTAFYIDPYAGSGAFVQNLLGTSESPQKGAVDRKIKSHMVKANEKNPFLYIIGFINTMSDSERCMSEDNKVLLKDNCFRYADSFAEHDKSIEDAYTSIWKHKRKIGFKNDINIDDL